MKQETKNKIGCFLLFTALFASVYLVHTFGVRNVLIVGSIVLVLLLILLNLFSEKVEKVSEVEQVIRECFESNEEREQARKIVNDFEKAAIEDRIRIRYDTSWWPNILQSFKLAKSIEDLNDVCSIILKIAKHLGGEAWDAACSENLPSYVEKAKLTKREYGDFQILFSFMPSRMDKVTKWAEFGGDRYYEVEEDEFVAAQLSLWITPLTKLDRSSDSEVG